ncbi:unnamed protein product [Protopolystoma xenopodis]|uniref:Uncharacterized protein n=1 Tax=Protopolystoma xenopodis TaxID=117903 RepID=A0A3S5BM31_9PLAT|nr:unnamed protein product [Protopolystoma xenopodis]
MAAFAAAARSGHHQLTAWALLAGGLDPSRLQADHDAFIKAFAIPTHLYRYLAECHRKRPLMLHRNLSYMRPPHTDCSLPIKVPGDGSTRKKASLSDIIERLTSSAQPQVSFALSDNWPTGSKSVTGESVLGEFIRTGPSTRLPKSTCSTKDSFKESMNLQDILHQNIGQVPHILSSGFQHWRVEICFEGFFDSEKEAEWVTVEVLILFEFRINASIQPSSYNLNIASLVDM